MPSGRNPLGGMRRPELQSRRPGRAILLLMSTFGVVLVAAGMLLALRSYDDRVDRVLARLFDAGRAGAEVVDDFFIGRLAVLEAASESIGRDTDAAPVVLDTISHPRMGFAGVWWIDHRGQGGLAESMSEEAMAGVPRPQLDRVLSSVVPHISDAWSDSEGNGPVVLLSAPSWRDGETEATSHLIAKVRVGDVVALLPFVTTGAGELSIVDRGGSLVVERGRVTGPAPLDLAMPLVAGGTTGTGIGGDLDRIVAISSADVAGWRVVLERDRTSALGADRARLVGELSILGALGLLGGAASLAVRRRMDDRHDLLLRRGRELTVLEDLTEALSGAIGRGEVIAAALEVFDGCFRGGISVVGIVQTEPRSIELACRASNGTVLQGHVALDTPSLFTDAMTFRGLVVEDGRSVEVCSEPPMPLAELGLGGVVAAGFSAAPSAGTVAIVLRDDFPPVREDIRLFEAMVRVFGQALSRALEADRARDAAHTLARAFRPRDDLPVNSPVQRSHWYVPAGDADFGGDWYDLVPLRDGQLGFVIGDVVGKGAVAAAVMAQLRGVLRSLMMELSSADEVLSRLDVLADTIPGAVGCAVTVAILDPSTGRLDVGCAGHLPPIVQTRDGVRIVTAARGVPIGVRSAESRSSHELRLSLGDVVVLYTDGLVQRREEVLDIGIARLATALALHHTRPVHALASLLFSACRGNAGFEDDCALMTIRLSGASPTNFSTLIPAESTAVRLLWHEFDEWLDARCELNLAGRRFDLLHAVTVAARGFVAIDGVVHVGIECEVTGTHLEAVVYSMEPSVLVSEWDDMGRWTSRIIDGLRIEATLGSSMIGPAARFRAVVGQSDFE